MQRAVQSAFIHGPICPARRDVVCVFAVVATMVTVHVLADKHRVVPAATTAPAAAVATTPAAAAATISG